MIGLQVFAKELSVFPFIFHFFVTARNYKLSDLGRVFLTSFVLYISPHKSFIYAEEAEMVVFMLSKRKHSYLGLLRDVSMLGDRKYNVPLEISLSSENETVSVYLW